MKSTFASVLVILATSAAARAQNHDREIIDLENQIAQAILNSDASFVERVFADDFFYTGIRGEVRAKQDIVNDLKSGELKFELMKFDDIKVRHFGETAVVTGLATTKGRGPKGEITGRFRYTRIYVKRQGAWQLILFQGTPLATSP